MQHVYELEALRLTQPSMLTIGVFDGVHRGHQHLIKTLVQQAHAQQQAAVVMTFHPHPDVVLRKIVERYYLVTPEQRAALMEQLGVDYLVTHPFNETVMRIRAADFVDRLVGHLNIKALWVGPDFALGHKREGNVPYLRARGVELGFSVTTIDLLTLEDGTVVSSSKIRAALREGDMPAVRKLLGRSYSVVGQVVEGDRRGRTIGFPTANVAVWTEQMIPANGVYAGWAEVWGQRYMAVTNVGVRPTFGGKQQTVEVHLLDFNHDIYGEALTFTFEKRLRPEQRFSGIDALVAQIQADAEAGRTYLTAQQASG